MRVKKEKKNIKKNEIKEIQKVETTKEVITKELLVDYLKTFSTGTLLTENEANQFIHIALAFQLNPFKREIYCIPYNTQQGKKLSIITGYETYLKRADRLRVLSGWNVITEGEGNDLKAVITIYRKDWKQPFKHEVFLREYKQENRMWMSKPLTMIKKVAVAQGFRLAFPDEFGGMPYTGDELPDNMTVENNITNNIEKLNTQVLKKDEKVIEIKEFVLDEEKKKYLGQLCKELKLKADDYLYLLKCTINKKHIENENDYEKVKDELNKRIDGMDIAKQLKEAEGFPDMTYGQHLDEIKNEV